MDVAPEGVAKSISGSLFPEGDRFNRRGHRPRMPTTIPPTLQGLHNPNEMQPLQGWWVISVFPVGGAHGY
jgi:hypothetical protein